MSLFRGAVLILAFVLMGEVSLTPAWAGSGCLAKNFDDLLNRPAHLEEREAPISARTVVTPKVGRDPASFPAFSEGRRMYLAGQSVTVRGAEVVIPELTYHAIPDGKSAQEMAEAFLSRKLGRSIHLGKPIGKGGTRLVFQHPLDAGQVIKVYDPTLAPERLSDSTVAKLIQRERALQLYLQELVSKFPVGAKPPFRLKHILSTKEEWEQGIIIQEKSSAVPEPELPSIKYKVGTHPLLDSAWKFLEKHDAVWKEVNIRVFNSELSIKGQNGQRRVVGIDRGSNFSNSPIGNDGVPELIDW